LHNLIDKKIDLSLFYECVHNDETGAPLVFAKQNTLRKPYKRKRESDGLLLGLN
jgi:hypothetical protein